MKEYDIKVIADKDELKVLFECDKEKNIDCNKKNCNEYCNLTTDSRYIKAKARQKNKGITDIELIINLEKEIEYYRQKLQQIQDDKIVINKPIDVKTYHETKLYADKRLTQIIIDYEY